MSRFVKLYSEFDARKIERNINRDIKKYGLTPISISSNDRGTVYVVYEGNEPAYWETYKN